MRLVSPHNKPHFPAPYYEKLPELRKNGPMNDISKEGTRTTKQPHAENNKPASPDPPATAFLPNKQASSEGGPMSWTIHGHLYDTMDEPYAQATNISSPFLDCSHPNPARNPETANNLCPPSRRTSLGPDGSSTASPKPPPRNPDGPNLSHPTPQCL